MRSPPRAAVVRRLVGEHALDALEDEGEIGERGPMTMSGVTLSASATATVMTSDIAGGCGAAGLKGCCRVSAPERRHDMDSTRAMTPTCSSCPM